MPRRRPSARTRSRLNTCRRSTSRRSRRRTARSTGGTQLSLVGRTFSAAMRLRCVFAVRRRAPHRQPSSRPPRCSARPPRSPRPAARCTGGSRVVELEHDGAHRTRPRVLGARAPRRARARRHRRRDGGTSVTLDRRGLVAGDSIACRFGATARSRRRASLSARVHDAAGAGRQRGGRTHGNGQTSRARARASPPTLTISAFAPRRARRAAHAVNVSGAGFLARDRPTCRFGERACPRACSRTCSQCTRRRSTWRPRVAGRRKRAVRHDRYRCRVSNNGAELVAAAAEFTLYRPPCARLEPATVAIGHGRKRVFGRHLARAHPAPATSSCARAARGRLSRVRALARRRARATRGGCRGLAQRRRLLRRPRAARVSPRLPSTRSCRVRRDERRRVVTIVGAHPRRALSRAASARTRRRRALARGSAIACVAPAAGARRRDSRGEQQWATLRRGCAYAYRPEQVPPRAVDAVAAPPAPRRARRQLCRRADAPLRARRRRGRRRVCVADAAAVRCSAAPGVVTA